VFQGRGPCAIFAKRFRCIQPGVRDTKDVYGVDVGREQELTKECIELGMLQRRGEERGDEKENTKRIQESRLLA
jgi:hypothetical protein